MMQDAIAFKFLAAALRPEQLATLVQKQDLRP